MARWRPIAGAALVVATLLVGVPAGAATAPVAEGAVVGFGGAPSGQAGEGVRAVTGTPTGWLTTTSVGIAATPTGAGHWTVDAAGGVVTHGTAPFFGSLGDVRLNQPVVGVAATPTGRGYWLVASDGGVFTFGDAPFAGAAGMPAVGLAPTPTGRGYWVAGPDGRVTALGDARHAGDLAGRVPDAAVAGIARVGAGYVLAVGPVRDALELWQPGGLRAPSQAWALRVADRAGARGTVWHRGNLDLLGVRRAGTTVQAVPSGWRVPMSSLAAEPGPSVPLLGPSVTAAIARNEVAMGAASAALRGARVGNTVDLLGWDGRIRTFRVGAIADDRRTGDAELVLSTATATSMGFRRPFTVRVWGVPRPALEAAMRAEPPPARMGLDRSWAPTGRDEIASAVRLKQALGEVAYRPTGGDGVALHPSFGGNVVSVRVPVLGTVTCHRAMLPALRGALTEVARAGLGGTLGRYGGCHNARLVRGGDSGGTLSRHSWGIAVDVNTTRNSFGGRVEMHPTVVAIFRRWGFAWGGTWVRADGMHFEWVP